MQTNGSGWMEPRFGAQRERNPRRQIVESEPRGMRETMMKFRRLAPSLTIVGLLAFSPLIWADKPPIVPPVIPQAAVECSGWHALCSLADDCTPDGVCDCWRINEPYMVGTGSIKNETIRAATQHRCTNKNPCGLDEAPVCSAIQSGNFVSDGVRAEWISTYSYRGWCENWEPVMCSDENGGSGPWADCMTSACWENNSGTDRPLSCSCTVNRGPFVGTHGSCTAAGGAENVMSTIPLHAWSFVNKTFTFRMPGYEFVKGACDTIHSDP